MNDHMFEIKINDNLSLRLRKPEDAEAIFEIIDRNRVEFRKWLLWVDATVSVSDTLAHIHESIEEFKNKTSMSFVVWYKNKIIGSVGFVRINNKTNDAEIGYWLDSNFQGKGTMRKCVKVLIDYGFNELNFHHIEIGCLEKNKASRSIPEYFGFKLKETFCEKREVDGVLENSLLFGLLKSDWLKSS